MRVTYWMRNISASILLLLIALSRFVLFDTLYFDQDEIWSIWQASGTLGEVLARNPFDFPAGFYLVLYGWYQVAGLSPFIMRVFLVLIFLINVSFVFVLAQRLLKQEQAGYYAVLAYAGLGYIVYLSVLLRPYPLVMMTFPMTFYAMLHYFDKPSWKSGIWLGLAMATMWYVALTAIFAYMVMGLYTIMRDIRLLQRWFLPGVIAFVVALPEIWSKLGIVLDRTSQVFELAPLPPLHIATYQRLVDYFGRAHSLWFGIILAAVIVAFISKGARKKYVVFFVLWLFGGIALLYISHSRTNFFQFARYGWWIAPSIALLCAQAITKLPRIGKIISSCGLLLLLFVPQTVGEYKEPIADFESTFVWLQEHYTSGDILVIDPNCDCQRADVWAYYERVYFPAGLNIVEAVSDNDRRVWYIRNIDRMDNATMTQINNTRIPSIFFGHPGFFLQLHVAPPNPEGILFENGLRYHGYEVFTNHSQRMEDSLIYRPEGSELRVRLWWSVAEPVEQDYSVGLQIYSHNWGLLSQDDQSPQPIFLQPNLYDYGTPSGLMSTWEPNTMYVEERVITLPYEPRLRRTTFTVYMTVYQWWDGVRLSANETNQDDLLPLFDFTIMAW